MKVGDLVIKKGDSDVGCVGVVLELTKPNSLGHSFVLVLRDDGATVTWYTNLVRVIESVVKNNKTD